jgi:hypothetical protein
MVDDPSAAVQRHVSVLAGVGGRLRHRQHDEARFHPASQVAAGEGGQVGVHEGEEAAELQDESAAWIALLGLLAEVVVRVKGSDVHAAGSPRRST